MKFKFELIIFCPYLMLVFKKFLFWNEFKIGVLVTEVPNTLSVYENDIDTSSSVIQYSNLKEDCIRGIVKSGDRMIILVDMIKMMDSEDLLKVTKIK